MNGAIGQHETRPPYRLSRGQVVLDAAASPSFSYFAENYLLENIEPFTLLFFEQDKKSWLLNELRWNGSLPYTRRLESSLPHIWSAPQLYTAEQHSRRRQWFWEWLEGKPAFNPEAILAFHLEAGKEAPSHSLLLNRGEKVKTLSITQVKAQAGNIQLTYSPPHQEKKGKSR